MSSSVLSPHGALSSSILRVGETQIAFFPAKRALGLWGQDLVVGQQRQAICTAGARQRGQRVGGSGEGCVVCPRSRHHRADRCRVWRWRAAAGSNAASPDGDPPARPWRRTLRDVWPLVRLPRMHWSTHSPSWKRRWRVIVRRHAPVAPRVRRRLLGDGGADRRGMAPVWRPDAPSMPHALTTHATFRRDDCPAGLMPRGSESPRRR